MFKNLSSSFMLIIPACKQFYRVASYLKRMDEKFMYVNRPLQKKFWKVENIIKMSTYVTIKMIDLIFEKFFVSFINNQQGWYLSLFVCRSFTKSENVCTIHLIHIPAITFTTQILPISTNNKTSPSLGKTRLIIIGKSQHSFFLSLMKIY